MVLYLFSFTFCLVLIVFRILCREYEEKMKIFLKITILMSFWPTSAISLCRGSISSDPMGIRWDDIENLSKNLHRAAPTPPGTEWEHSGPLPEPPNMTTNIANFAIFRDRTLQNPYVGWCMQPLAAEPDLSRYGAQRAKSCSNLARVGNFLLRD